MQHGRASRTVPMISNMSGGKQCGWRKSPWQIIRQILGPRSRGSRRWTYTHMHDRFKA